MNIVRQKWVKIQKNIFSKHVVLRLSFKKNMMSYNVNESCIDIHHNSAVMKWLVNFFSILTSSDIYYCVACIVLEWKDFVACIRKVFYFK